MYLLVFIIKDNVIVFCNLTCWNYQYLSHSKPHDNLKMF